MFKRLTGLVFAASLVAFGSGFVRADETTAHDFVFQTPSGSDLPLSDYKGKLVLVVNTATACGYSGQIGDLQELWQLFADQGLIVLGVPSNDFGGQEPRSDGEIAGFCEARYGARFPMTIKTHVKGPDAHPFYRWASDTLGVAARPYWNFHKYLVGPDGQIIDWFSTPTKPTSRKVVMAIETQLAKVAEKPASASR
jgi:glutathione peroxidase